MVLFLSKSFSFTNIGTNSNFNTFDKQFCSLLDISDYGVYKWDMTLDSTETLINSYIDRKSKLSIGFDTIDFFQNSYLEKRKEEFRFQYGKLYQIVRKYENLNKDELINIFPSLFVNEPDYQSDSLFSIENFNVKNIETLNEMNSYPFLLVLEWYFKKYNKRIILMRNYQNCNNIDYYEIITKPGFENLALQNHIDIKKIYKSSLSWGISMDSVRDCQNILGKSIIKEISFDKLTYSYLRSKVKNRNIEYRFTNNQLKTIIMSRLDFSEKELKKLSLSDFMPEIGSEIDPDSLKIVDINSLNKTNEVVFQWKLQDNYYKIILKRKAYIYDPITDFLKTWSYKSENGKIISYDFYKVYSGTP